MAVRPLRTESGKEAVEQVVDAGHRLSVSRQISQTEVRALGKLRVLGALLSRLCSSLPGFGRRRRHGESQTDPTARPGGHADGHAIAASHQDYWMAPTRISPRGFPGRK